MIKPPNPSFPTVDEITEKSSRQSEKETTQKIPLNQLPTKNMASVKSRAGEITEKLEIKHVSAKEYKNQTRMYHKAFTTSTEILAKKRNLFQRVRLKTCKEKFLNVLKMVKIQHTIFALPFALTATFLATSGKPKSLDIAMIVLAMVTARNGAMSFNRIVDADMDKLNPRTKDREIPRGIVSRELSVGFCVTNCILFVIISSYFNWLTFILSPISLGFILGYSLTKRFTSYTHIFLGLALGISPSAAWIAMTGSLALTPLFLSVAVVFWVAGFDMIYATLDEDFDKKHGGKSLVIKLGLKNALNLAKVFHGLTLVFLFLVGLTTPLSWFYFLGCLIVLGLLMYEHSLVKPTDLSQVNTAFFTLNGCVAIVYFVFTVLDIYV